MTEINQNLAVYRGDTQIFFVALTDETTGDPLDIDTVTSIRWRLATTSYSLRPLVSKELGAGIVPVEGGVNVELSAEDTDQEYGVFYHEMKIITGAQVETALTGNFIVRHSLDMSEQVPVQMQLEGSSGLSSDITTLPV